MSIERDLEETKEDVARYREWYSEYQTRYFKTRMHLHIVGLCLFVSLYFTGLNCSTSWKLADQNRILEKECSVFREDLKGLMDHVKIKP